MKNPIIRNGLYAAALLIGVMLLEFMLGRGKEIDYGSSEIIGYLTILASMFFVFLGIRQFRDQEQNGYLTFWEGVKVGALIVVIPSLAFGLYNVIYVLWLNPEFMDDYFNYSLEQLQASLPPTEYEIKAKELLEQKATFMNPLVNFAVMFFTVFIIGIIVALGSAFALNKPRPEEE